MALTAQPSMLTALHMFVPLPSIRNEHFRAGFFLFMRWQIKILHRALHPVLAQQTSAKSQERLKPPITLEHICQQLKSNIACQFCNIGEEVS